MPVFTARTDGYKGGFFLLFFATAMFFVGCSTPFWAFRRYTDPKDSAEITIRDGPCYVCVTEKDRKFLFFKSTFTICFWYGFRLGPTGWFHAVRALLAICQALLFSACIYALVINCCRALPGPKTRLLEILAGSGGVLGLLGVIVYGAVRRDQTTSIYAMDLLDVSLGGRDWRAGWSICLAGVGSVLAVVAAVIIVVTNKEISQPTIGAVMATTPAVAAVSVTTNQTTNMPAYAGGPPGYGEYPGQAAFSNPGYLAQGGSQPAQGGYEYTGKF